MQTKQARRGFSLIEMLAVLVLVAGLVVLAITTMSGLKQKESVDQVAQLIINDLVQIRSRALTTNTGYRVVFVTATSWKLQRNQGGTWVDDSDIRHMPSQTFLTSQAFANAGSNLEATARGLYAFAGGATGTPYVTISGTGVAQTRSINVYVGGAIEKTTP